MNTTIDAICTWYHSFIISGISSLSQPGGSKNNSMLQKKSIFTIAYDDMSKSNIQPLSPAYPPDMSNKDIEE